MLPVNPHGFIIGGRTVAPKRSLRVYNYRDDMPQLALRDGNDMRRRTTRWVRAIVLHTTKGLWPQVIKPGAGPCKNVGEKVAKFWTTSPAHAGAHLVIDSDGTITCHCDLLYDAAYHAGIENEYSIGIEIFQEEDGSIYEVQLETAVLLTDELTEIFRIQRQVPMLSTTAVIPRLQYPLQLKDVVGVFGHRHFTSDRGRGDPGDPIFEALAAVGYEQFAFNGSGEDIDVWKKRQYDLGIPSLHCDGVPGPQTCDLLQANGHASGLWVKR